MMNLFSTTIRSPIGPLGVDVDDAGHLVAIRFHATLSRGNREAVSRCAHVAAELEEYFAGTRREFSLQLALAGTEFQREVWSELQRIPFGETIHYGELARRVGRPKAIRAVGQANGRNPIPIVVPCHRVIGANGTLTGFGGGIETKRQLLDHEQGHSGLFANAGEPRRERTTGRA